MDVKQQLDLAVAKIKKGLLLEKEGRKLWIEGTLELMQILDKGRRDNPGPILFSQWLKMMGFHKGGDNFITNNDRIALLNMALHPELTREVLEQTSRRSYHYIWPDVRRLVIANCENGNNG